MSGQASITKFFRPVTSSPDPGPKKVASKDESAGGSSQSENLSPNPMAEVRTPEKPAKRKLDELEGSPSSSGSLTPGENFFLGLSNLMAPCKQLCQLCQLISVLFRPYYPNFSLLPP